MMFHTNKYQKLLKYPPFYFLSASNTFSNIFVILKKGGRFTYPPIYPRKKFLKSLYILYILYINISLLKREIIYINYYIYIIYYTRMFFYPNFIHGRHCSPHPVMGSVYHLGGGYDEA